MRDWPSKSFHDQISTKDGAGPEDRIRDLLNTSLSVHPTDLVGPADLKLLKIIIHPY